MVAGGTVALSSLYPDAPPSPQQFRSAHYREIQSYAGYPTNGLLSP
jgi:hypothetical protein